MYICAFYCYLKPNDIFQELACFNFFNIACSISSNEAKSLLTATLLLTTIGSSCISLETLFRLDPSHFNVIEYFSFKFFSSFKQSFA